MAHKHSVYDMNTHFIIDPITRAITNKDAEKIVLIQYDHNSERFTFEIPQIVEGHDMALCNKIEVHFINIDSKTKDKSPDVYPVTDATVTKNESGENILLFSWLISQNATVYAGAVAFLIRFACVDDDGTFTYKWHTAKFVGVPVSDGINNSPVVAELYSDVLTRWENTLFAAGYINAEAMQNDIAVLSSRMDTFTSLKDGSTTGDAELSDIRVGANGVKYESAGSAVRNQIKTLNAEMRNLEIHNVKGVTLKENLLPAEYWENIILGTAGQLSTSTTYKLSDYVSVEAGASLHRLDTTTVELIGCYDINKEWLSRGEVKVGASEFVVPENCSYVRFNISGDLKNRQVYSTETPTEYVSLGVRQYVIDSASDLSKLAYPKLVGKRWLFLGDSITEGVGASSPEACYVSKAIAKSGAVGTNMGVGGASLQYRESAESEAKSIYTASAEIDFAEFDIVTIFAGTNDILANIGDTDSETSTDACGALNIIIQNILTSNPDIKIVFFAPMFRSRFTSGDGKNSDDYSWYGNYLYDLADKLELVCKKNHIPCKNLYWTAQVNKHNSESYLADGLHPNDFGHNYLSDIICEFVNQNVTF